MMMKGARIPAGGWSAVPWGTLGLTLLISAAWVTSVGRPRVVRADAGARPEQRAVGFAAARRLREALGGIPLAGASLPGPAMELPTGAARPRVAAPGPASDGGARIVPEGG